ncbi:MAG: acyltransferase [Candidatus Hydrogenedentes bacterium]|nr:acyltransferase [Candidatus Hydrogenedentota bacterium]
MRSIALLIYKILVAIRSRYYIAYYSLVHGVEFGTNVRVYSRLIIHGPGKVVIGDGTRISSRRAINELCTTNPDAVLRIGSHCLLNGAIIGSAKSVTIGDRCIIAEAYIRDTSSHGMAPDQRHLPGSGKIAPVELSDNVWIGSQSHVMPGVQIGENTVVGVNSVVTKSLPENVFAAGSPAKVIHDLET